MVDEREAVFERCALYLSVPRGRLRERRINTSRSFQDSVRLITGGRLLAELELIKLWPRLNVTDQTREHGLIRMVLIHSLFSGAKYHSNASSQAFCNDDCITTTNGTSSLGESGS